MPKLTLRYPPTLTRAQIREAYNEGQTRFWLASLDRQGEIDKFINIGRHSAANPLAVVLDIDFGLYMLGSGWGRNRLRKKLRIDLVGVHFL
jgi:hypothetical protein